VTTPANVLDYIASLSGLSLADKVEAINQLREAIHEVSPFRSEPVDFVRWVPNALVHSNDYNPNSVAPPEMELLRLSIDADGYTQPIVSMADPDDTFEVIDGFHRHRVGKECMDIQSRVHGYLPLVQIRESQSDKTDRMASTIRHSSHRAPMSVYWKMPRPIAQHGQQTFWQVRLTRVVKLFRSSLLQAILATAGSLPSSHPSVRQVC
jgi:ParB-like chromosome segregation protein Spo0J